MRRRIAFHAISAALGVMACHAATVMFGSWWPYGAMAAACAGIAWALVANLLEAVDHALERL